MKDLGHQQVPERPAAPRTGPISRSIDRCYDCGAEPGQRHTIKCELSPAHFHQGWGPWVGLIGYGLYAVNAIGRIIAGYDFKPGWVMDYDPDAFDGLGDVQVTDDPRQAIAFVDAGSAIKFYETVSTVRPLRHDGLPNRPLTAFTIEVRELEQEGRR